MGKMLTFILQTPKDVRQGLAQRARSNRLHKNLSQEGLARRAGVSAGTIKRFEKTGHISIDSLLKIALVLDVLEDFSTLFKHDPTIPKSIDDIINAPKLPQRGRRK